MNTYHSTPITNSLPDTCRLSPVLPPLIPIAYNLLIALLFAFILFVPSLASAHVYYVSSTSGNDSNTGSETAPFKTWKKVLKVLDKNDTVVFPAADQPDYFQANRVLMKQSDVKRGSKWVDRGTWKQRLQYIEMASKQAGIKTLLKFNYEIKEPVKNGQNTINTIGVKRIVETKYTKRK